MPPLRCILGQGMSSALLHLIEPHKICFEQAYAALDAAEKKRADAFYFEKDRKRWVCVRAQSRRLLAGHLGIPALDLEWAYLEHGKPQIAGHDLSFNLSHSPLLSVLAISPLGPVGVDLEARERGSELVEAAAVFCHPEEIALLPREGVAERLLELWTAKEAFLKALGTGFSQDPQEILVRGNLATGPPSGLAGLHLLRPSRHASLDPYAVAMAVPKGIEKIELREHQ